MSELFENCKISTYFYTMTNNRNQLKNLVYKGAKEKDIVITDHVLDRISYELYIIEELGFTDYFILYSRIIEVCNKLNLLRSYGRANALNSMVNYCLDITKINPIEENLAFERFVHPQQKQFPDIDTDIPKGQQINVIKELKRAYPEYNTYLIAISPQWPTDYETVICKDKIYKKHPCGVIITPDKLTHSTFRYQEQDYYLALNPRNNPIYENRLDILELEYLNRLQLIVNEIGEQYHPYKLPLNDKEVFHFFISGNLENVFQFDNSSLKEVFDEFKPDSIYDLAIINALSMPSLVEYTSTIISNKHNQNHFGPSDSRVLDILNETYGWLIYQETFLHLAKEIAGMSYTEAESWRSKIMRGLDDIESITFRSDFANGCREYSSLNESEITAFTNLILMMLPRSFQRAHSLSYSIIGYWGAYYKTHFRKEFDMVFSKDLNFK